MNVAELERLLSSPDVETRRQAVALAGGARRSELGAGLLRALGDADYRVREEAVAALTADVASYALIPELVAGLAQSENVGLRCAARDALRGLGAAAAPALIEALSDVEPLARKFVLEALSADGSDEAFGVLAQAARGDDVLLAASAIEALSRHQGERTIEALRGPLRSTEAFVRAAALDALVRLDASFAWEDVALLRSDRVLGRMALGALVRTHDERAAPLLVRELDEPSARGLVEALLGLSRLYQRGEALRRAVVQALSSLSSTARERLRRLASDDRYDVAHASCLVLACARDAEIVELAIAVTLRGGAPAPLAAALVDGGEAHVAALADVAGAANRAGDERGAALELLSEIARAGDEALEHELRPLLLSALSAHESSVRHAALRVLARLARAEDAPRLLAEATSDDGEAAQLAGAALSELARREPAAVRHVLAAPSFEGPAGATLAVLAAELGADAVLDRLRDALLSHDVPARAAALAGLARMSGPQARELVLLALRDDSPEVQVAAFDALVRSSERETDVEALFAVRTALLQWQGDDADAEAALARALAQHDDEAVRARLRGLAERGSTGARLFALQGLLRLSDPALDPLLAAALRDDDSELVKQAVLGIAQIGGSRAGVRIAAALAHAAWDVRLLAAQWIARLHATDALAALHGQLAKESDDYVRAALLDALARLGGR